MIRLDVVSVGVVEEADAVVLVLRSPEIPKLLVMEIGLFEARAITIELEQVKTPRPITHHLLLQTAEALGARVSRAVIREFRDKTFFADLILTKADGSEVTIDARPSDVIALALRAGAPILTNLNVLEEAGITEEPHDGDDEIEESTIH